MKQLKKRNMGIYLSSQNLFDSVRLMRGGIPPVVDDEEVGFGEAGAHFVEKIFLLRW